MMSPQRAGINADTAEVKSDIGTNRQRPARLVHPDFRGQSLSSVSCDAHARRGTPASNCGDKHYVTQALVLAVESSGVRFHVNIHGSSWVRRVLSAVYETNPMVFWAKSADFLVVPIGWYATLPNNETNPTVFWVEFTDFYGVTRCRARIPVAERRNEPNGILGNACRLCGRGLGLGLTQEKRETKPFRLLRISRAVRSVCICARQRRMSGLRSRWIGHPDRRLDPGPWSMPTRPIRSGWGMASDGGLGRAPRRPLARLTRPLAPITMSARAGTSPAEPAPLRPPPIDPMHEREGSHHVPSRRQEAGPLL